VAQLRISPRASADLIEIWNYIADDSVVNADRRVDKLYETLQVLCRQPGSGRRREELAPGIRSFPFGRYVIFYRASRNAIEIVRVLHGGRDIESIFEGHAEHSDPES
jgi:toxin ParE1/3/4